MAKVIFREDRCKGCGLCIHACPEHILDFAKQRLNEKGFYPAEIVDQDACIACAFCATICPDCVITIEK